MSSVPPRVTDGVEASYFKLIALLARQPCEHVGDAAAIAKAVGDATSKALDADLAGSLVDSGVVLEAMRGSPSLLSVLERAVRRSKGSFRCVELFLPITVVDLVSVHMSLWPPGRRFRSFIMTLRKTFGRILDDLGHEEREDPFEIMEMTHFLAALQRMMEAALQAPKP
eukprot:evm.model.scf_274.11 EVM.evm.TU.scf_274.11   scf_274:77008-79828(+)